MEFKYRVDGRGRMEEDIVEDILKARNIKDVRHFLNPSKQDLISPLKLTRIDEAADLVLDAVDEKKRIFVNLDSDLDGVSAGTIIYRWLEQQYGEDADQLGWSINEGKTHGMTPEIVQKMADFQPDLIIIVDSLDNHLRAYRTIKEATGADIIVLDHHMINPVIDYDSEIILVSSQRDYPNKGLCGAGVAYKFVEYLNMLAPYPFDRGLIELAAAGTVGDVMSLDEDHMENRAIVAMALRGTKPINYFTQEIVGRFEFNAKSFSFSVAPLINAANRLKENELAAQCVLFDTVRDVSKDVKKLKALKDKQNALVDKAMVEINKQIESEEDRSFVCTIIDESISELSGLIANKLMSEKGKPALVLVERPYGYSGSGRASTVADFNQLCMDTGLAQCAGHENAFGIVKLNYEDFDNFCKKLDNILESEGASKPVIEVDCLIEPEDMTTDLIERVKYVDRISGNGFPSLEFAVVLDDYFVSTMSKGKHIVFSLMDCSAVFIQWNHGGSLEEYEEHAINHHKMLLTGSLECGNMGKDDRRMIINHIEFED